jgi:hypothetical protein
MAHTQMPRFWRDL